jgi:CBS domain-containing protein
MKLNQIQTYAIALLVVVLGIITLGDILNVVSPDTTFVNLLIVAGVTIGIALSGFKQVTVVHEAVLTVLGTRTPIILMEGWVWIFPWIMDFIEVNV